MLTGMRGRVMLLLVAATLAGGAVVVRVWLAATGGYGNPALVPLRVVSAIALFGGLLLAGLTVAWPMPSARRPEGGSAVDQKREGGANHEHLPTP